MYHKSYSTCILVFISSIVDFVVFVDVRTPELLTRTCHSNKYTLHARETIWILTNDDHMVHRRKWVKHKRKIDGRNRSMRKGQRAILEIKTNSEKKYIIHRSRAKVTQQIAGEKNWPISEKNSNGIEDLESRYIKWTPNVYGPLSHLCFQSWWMREKDTIHIDHAVSHSPRTDDCFRYASFLLLFFFFLFISFHF